MYSLKKRFAYSVYLEDNDVVHTVFKVIRLVLSVGY